jgi:glutamyl-tRNA reductase
MENNNTSKHQYFTRLSCYKKADAEIRGKFSLDGVAKTRLLEQAKNEGIESL